MKLGIATAAMGIGEIAVKRAARFSQFPEHVQKKMLARYRALEYPTEAHGSIPAFQNHEEEATWWDIHDFTDFQETEE